MKPIDDLLRSKAEGLDLERGDHLAAIQEELNKKYPGKVRAKRLKDGILTITTPSSAVAGELRLGQVKLIKQLKKYDVEKTKINIA